MIPPRRCLAAALDALAADIPLGGPPPVSVGDVLADAITCPACVEGIPHDPTDHDEPTPKESA
jgi:hypothetical protein